VIMTAGRCTLAGVDRAGRGRAAQRLCGALHAFRQDAPEALAMIDRLQAVEYGVESAAENIAHKQTTPRKVMASWMESEGHKKNILTGDFIHIGVAVARSAKGERYWVQVFATPLVK